jgi:hypothetical protein
MDGLKKRKHQQMRNEDTDIGASCTRDHGYPPEEGRAARKSYLEVLAPFDTVQLEEIVQEDRFRLPRDGSRVEKALDLAGQLLMELEGDKAAVEFCDGAEMHSSARQKIINATHNFETHIRDHLNGPPRSIVMLGVNGDQEYLLNIL